MIGGRVDVGADLGSLKLGGSLLSSRIGFIALHLRSSAASWQRGTKKKALRSICNINMSSPLRAFLMTLGLSIAHPGQAQHAPAPPLRAGMIGIDTSHVPAFAKIHRGKAVFGAVVYGSKAIVPVSKGGSYEELCREIGRFFKTGKPPVTSEETIEIFAFMEAADESKRQGGTPVSLKDVLAKRKVGCCEEAD